MVMNAALYRRGTFAVVVAVCAALSVAWAKPCQADGGSSPPPSGAQQFLDRVTQLEGFLEQLKQREPRTPRKPRHAINTFDDLANLWDRVWKDLNRLHPHGALEDELSTLGEPARQRNLDEPDDTEDADGF